MVIKTNVEVANAMLEALLNEQAYDIYHLENGANLAPYIELEEAAIKQIRKALAQQKSKNKKQ